MSEFNLHAGHVIFSRSETSSFLLLRYPPVNYDSIYFSYFRNVKHLTTYGVKHYKGVRAWFVSPTDNSWDYVVIIVIILYALCTTRRKKKNETKRFSTALYYTTPASLTCYYRFSIQYPVFKFKCVIHHIIIITIVWIYKNAKRLVSRTRYYCVPCTSFPVDFNLSFDASRSCGCYGI